MTIMPERGPKFTPAEMGKKQEEALEMGGGVREMARYFEKERGPQLREKTLKDIGSEVI